GIGCDDAVRNVGADRRAVDQPVAEAFASHALAEQGRRQAIVGEHLLEGLLAELAVDAGEGRVAGDFGIDQLLRDLHAGFRRELHQRGLVDHLVDHEVEAALGEELLHRDALALALHAADEPVDPVLHFGVLDLLAAHRGQRAARRAAARVADAGDVARGKGDG
ncbi:hypothetical protein QU38_02205, partial [Staphylococcus aureus]